MSDYKRGLKPKDFELLEYFKDYPYFSVKYDSSAQHLDQRDFKDICDKVNKNLSRRKNKIKKTLCNIILKYAKLNLLLSRGQVTEKELLKFQCTSSYVKGKLDFLKVFVSGFTDDDIPQPIHDYYNNFFKIAVKTTEISIYEVETYMKSIKNENDLSEKDMLFINNAIRESFQGTCIGEQTSCETRMFQALRVEDDEGKKETSKDTTREVAVAEPMYSLLQNTKIKKEQTESVVNIVDSSVSEAIVRDTFKNKISNNTNVAKPSESTCYVYSHMVIKKEINDSEMDVDEHSVSDAIEEDTLKNNISNFIFVEIPQTLPCPALIKINKNINDSDMDKVEHCNSEVEDTSMNIIPNNTYGVKTEPTCSFLPNVNKINDSDMGIIGHGVFNVEDSLKNNTIPIGVDLNKYMKDIAEYLCQRLPMEKRRGFLNQVDLIVSKILEE